MMRSVGFKFVIGLGLYFMMISAMSQDLRHFDSLKSVLKKTHGIDRFDVLYDMIRKSYEWNIDTAMAIAFEARKCAIEHGDSVRLMTANRILGQLHNRLFKTKDAEVFLLAALPASIKYHDRDAQFKILTSLGISNLFRSNYGESLDYFFKARDVLHDSVDQESFASVNLNLGLLYYKLEQPQKAIHHYRIALRHFRDSSETANALVNIALAFNTIHPDQKAERYLDSASAICGQGKCVKRIELSLQFAKGYCKYFQSRFYEAEKELTNALALAEVSKDVRFKAECLLNLAKVEMKLNKYSSAYLRLKMVEDICLSSGIYEVLDDVYRTFADFYFKKKDFEAAIRYSKLFTNLNDSLQNQEVRNKLLALEVEHAQKESNEKILAQEKLLVMKEEMIQSQRMGFIAFSIAGALLLLLLVVFWKHSKEKSRMNKLLEERVEERTRALHERLRAIEESESFEALTSLSAIKNMRKSIASLQGLFQVAINQINDPSVSKEVQARLLIISNDIQENLTLMQKRENTL